MRQEPPRDATAQHVKDRIDDLAQGPRTRSPASVRDRHEGLDESPLGIAQIGFVAQVIAAMLPPSGWGPHRGSGGFDTLSEARRSQPLNPFRSGLLVARTKQIAELEGQLRTTRTDLAEAQAQLAGARQ